MGAVERLSTTEIMAPIYYIIAGNDNDGNGAIITRNQTAVNGPIVNGEEYTKPLYLKDDSKYSHGWYIVETNYDYWVPAKDPRRAAAIKSMDEMGQKGVDFDGLFEVLSKPPVLASGTVFTSLYEITEGDFNITVRYD